MNRTMTFRRHLFLTTACCAGLMIGGASALAQQQAAGLVQPKGGWAVTRIDESSTQGGAYCTLARQYQNGVILSIGRNKAEEYSIAVDYQDAKLDKDKPYDVTLKAGNQTRQLQMIPVSTRAMVIRLGWDDSFFAAMEKSQNFSMTLDKTEKVELALTEYAKGKTDLAQCMETLKEGGQSAPSGNTDILNAEAGAASGFSATRTAQAASAAPSAAAPVDETKRPEATRITQLDTPMVPRGPSEDRAAYVAPMRSSDVASLETENEKLRQQLNEQRRAYETRLSEAGGQGNRVAELEEKLRLAERRGGAAPAAAPAAATPAVVPVPTPVVKEVVKEVEVVKPDPAQAQKVAALESELADLRRQLSARPATPAAGEMKAAPTPMPNPDQAKRITALQEEVEGLKKQLAVASAAPAAPSATQTPRPPSPGNLAAVETLQATLADRDREINDLQSKLITQNHAVAAQNDVESLRRQLQQRENHVRSAQQHIAARDREVSQLRQQVAQLQRATSAPAAARAQRSSASAPVAPAPVAAAPVAPVTPAPGVAAVTPPPAAPVAQVATAAGGSGLQSALSRAGISANATSGTNGASEAWQWRNGSLAGRAEAYQGRGNATDVSQQYANTQRSACAGDFAAVPGPSQGGRVSLDLACVESNGNVRTHSTLFTEQGGQVVALILEAPAEDMDRAMDARDRLGGQL